MNIRIGESTTGPCVLIHRIFVYSNAACQQLYRHGNFLCYANEYQSLASSSRGISEIEKDFNDASSR